ncbi:MAG: hypothetical protein JW704_06480 [Anaerolineaceae bacterium]|nr:hypothetical protein [Anaerolineaceae bacterium]MBN2678337.1 hypothetical protein [Anaerolineaceae bacterium]
MIGTITGQLIVRVYPPFNRRLAFILHEIPATASVWMQKKEISNRSYAAVKRILAIPVDYRSSRGLSIPVKHP